MGWHAACSTAVVVVGAVLSWWVQEPHLAVIKMGGLLRLGPADHSCVRSVPCLLCPAAVNLPPPLLMLCMQCRAPWPSNAAGAAASVTTAGTAAAAHHD